MSRIETCLLLAVIPAALIAAGYWLAAGLREISAAERLAVAMLSGLGAALWGVSMVNMALPLDGIWGWLCVMPWMAPLVRTQMRQRLKADAVATFCNLRGFVVVSATVTFLGALLWPTFSRPELVYYDGTSSHDAFFWIVGAEHLKRQTYLQQAVASPVYPLFYSIESIAGLKPVWGRMGAEGLLAVISNLAGVAPLKLYVAATAALFFPWIAATFLVMRTFLVNRVALGSAVGLVLLQPTFVFFHANANLPNLVGVIAGAGVVIALARATDRVPGSWRWLVLVMLSVHALMCSYPEMLPAIALPAGLLIARAWGRAGLRAGFPLAGRTMLAGLAGATINPVTTIRAWSGLASSLAVAKNMKGLPNIFDSVSDGARIPAMVTLSAPLGREIGAIGGLVCALAIALAIFLAIARARDRFGALAMLAGGGAILAYTTTAHFGYGWQKTVQFSAIFLAALVPFGALSSAGDLRKTVGEFRAVVRLGIAATVAFYTAATAVNIMEVHKWSERKFLTLDWFELRDFSRQHLHNVPVLVDADTFSRPFFYSMWAAYFLDDSRIYFTGDKVSGGYLRPSVEKYPPDWIESPRAVLLAGGTPTPSDAVQVWRRGAVAIVTRNHAAEDGGRP